jgi:SAM-dependent methyltransferase
MKDEAVNAAIAENYDAVMYDPGAVPFLDIANLFGHAALFGEVAKPVDVLDIACGTGVQLTRVAEQVTGKLVGTDISAAAVKLAQERLAPFGKRAKVSCADLLEVDPADLGQFDLIYNIGVIFVTPPPVQHKILEIIGKCLRPGGVAVLSYYAGSNPTIRANLHRMLRSGLDGLPRGDTVQIARARAESWAKQLEAVPGSELQRAAIATTLQQQDVIFFHEVLNNTFDAMQTSSIEQALAKYGLTFAWYLTPAGHELPATSQERALAADFADLAQGQYRYPVFAKYDQPTAIDATSQQIVWQSSLFRDTSSGLDGEQQFAQREGIFTATVRLPACIAMLDCLAEDSLGWRELVGQTEATLRQSGKTITPEDHERMAADLKLFWSNGLIAPHFRPLSNDQRTIPL